MRNPSVQLSTRTKTFVRLKKALAVLSKLDISKWYVISAHNQIALGGTIGTGLYLTSGMTLYMAGAMGALLAYLTAGIAVFFVVSSLGINFG
jgi:hypothetical protein